MTPGEPLRVVDPNIRRGHTYTYRVVAIGTDGKRVGVSNAEWLRVRLPGCEDRPELRLRDRRRPPGRRVPLGQGGSPARGTLRARALGRRRPPRADLPHRGRRTPVVLRHGRRGRPVDPLQGVRPRRRRPDRGRQPGRHRARARPSRRRSDGAGAIRAVDTGTLAGVDGRAGDEADERELVERARVDPSAFAELYRRYLPRVHAFAYRRTGAVEVAEDITSAAFERALRNLRRVQLAARRLRPVAVPDRLERARRSLPADGPRRLRSLDRRGASGSCQPRRATRPTRSASVTPSPRCWPRWTA